MPAANTIKQPSNNIKAWILSFFILIVLSFLFTFSYRERIALSVANYFVNTHGIKVEEFNGLTIEFDMRQPFFIDNISIDHIGFNIDYLQFERVTASSANQSDPKDASASLSFRKLPNWIPDLHISTIAVQGVNLPRVADLFEDQEIPLSNLTLQAIDKNLEMFNTVMFKELDFKYDVSKAEFGFVVWQQAEQLVQAKLSYTFSPDQDKVIQGNSLQDNSLQETSLQGKSIQGGGHQSLQVQLTTDLTHLTSTAKQLIPNLDSTVSGIVVVDLDIKLESVNNVALTLSLAGAGISHNNQVLMANTDLSVDTVLAFDGQKWTPEYTEINIAGIDPITLTEKSCAAYTALFNMEDTACKSFSKGASPRLLPIVITTELPLTFKVDIQEQNIERWEIQAKRLAMKAVMVDNIADQIRRHSIEFKTDNLQLTPESLRMDWSLAMRANSLYISEMDVPLQVKTAGKVEVSTTESSPNIKLIVKQALLNVPEFKYTESSNTVLSSHNIKVSLLKSMTVNFESNRVEPFDFDFSTASYTNSYQKNMLSEYEVARFTGQHQGHFSPELLSVNSGWQLDDLELKSNNTVYLSNLEPQSVVGNLQLPSQHIPSLISDKYPLPSGLHLPAFITNRFDYTVRLNQQQDYLSANMVGNLIAGSSTFNEITATDINTHWRCNIAADKPALAATVAAKCNLNTTVESVDMGPVVTDINLKGLVTYTNEQLQVAVDKASAKAFSSTISLSPLLITDFNHIVGKVHIRDLSLPEVLELYQVPGVKVTGLLKAGLPFVAKGSQVSITDGWIEQQGAGGLIEIKDNVTIDQLKLTQPQLRYALELLENLHYDTLHSDVNFEPSGETKLTINIKGRNPSVERPIEFNYSHEENILQLFRSLRINDSMYDALDKMNNP